MNQNNAPLFRKHPEERSFFPAVQESIEFEASSKPAALRFRWNVCRQKGSGVGCRWSRTPSGEKPGCFSWSSFYEKKHSSARPRRMTEDRCSVP
ncbi:hypothetical protein C6I21_00145 [Alkalicoccus urumqiensis]|uniref:Uncharacterized protein n=1 Tax=Alkalicoccus urumqiensis TaxID=1548213 RepID=A0A2P6ML68_ALKUR|nr:hypothetical protein C6I21_00145 [Alkalicoccus urumqiensis]